MLWANAAYGRLPRHVRALDVGAVRANGDLVPLGNAEELFILTEFVDGHEYADDLIRLRAGEPARPLDRARADALCDYLVGIHSRKGADRGLYLRRVRELIGHGECIFGVCDSYPDDGPVALERLRAIERRLIDWRWRLRGRAGRLCHVHGDFHPWNILFRDGTDFSVLDRSRGEWGEAADDVACLSLNYLFFSLQRSGRLEGDLRELWLRFWARYLDRTSDRELLEVAAPFFAFRALVMANPLWYPTLAPGLRDTLLGFTEKLLAAERFAPERVDDYLA
jgi:aminoglycoside phosphotransferase (APT) family kinase protein